MYVFSCGSPFGIRPCTELAKSCKGQLNTENYPPKQQGPIAVWGQLRGARELLNGKDEFYRLDHAYIGRGDYYRMTKGDFMPSKVLERPADRWEALQKRYSLEMQDWQRGEHIVLALSMPGTYDFFNVTGWAKDIQKKLESCGRKVVVRQRKETKPIKEDLKNAYALVTFASNSVMEALLMGVPVVVRGPSIARPVSGSLDEPAYPDREKFFRHVAYCQFNLDEFRSGFALKTTEENWAGVTSSSRAG